MSSRADTHAPAPDALQITEARQALYSGDRDGAYRRSIEITTRDPNQIEAWILRAKTAPSNEDRLFSLSQVNRLAPNNPEAKRDLYWTLWSELDRDPFLAYLDETDDVYYVRNNSYLSLVVPKDRRTPETYPPVGDDTLRRAYRWLGLAVLGLSVAGLGTLLFAPLALLSAFRAVTKPVTRADAVRAGLIMVLSLGLLAVAVFLGYLLWIHLPAGWTAPLISILTRQ